MAQTRIKFAWKWQRDSKYRATALAILNDRKSVSLHARYPGNAFSEDVTLSPEVNTSIRELVKTRSKDSPDLELSVAQSLDNMAQEWIRNTYPDLDLQHFFLIDQVSMFLGINTCGSLKGTFVLVSIKDRVLICSANELPLGPDYYIDHVLLETEINFWRDKLGLPHPNPEVDD